MSRSRTKLKPWIEHMIASHGTESEKAPANLKARVIAVGQMPHSQAMGAQGPPELLFLSDGVVQIPGILTAAAWEHLQEEEERECFSSLVNTTVCLQTYTLQFHMAPEKRKSRFYLSIGKLTAMAAGPVKECPPCCTTLSSVRAKICDMWKAQQGQNLAQTEGGQSGVDLSQLLGVWQYDCLMDLVEEVQEMLTPARASASPRPSTSSRDPPLAPPATATARLRTGWDVDRVRCKGAEPFSVPVAHLLIPDTVALPLTPTPPGEGSDGSTTQSGLIPPSSDPLVMHSTSDAQPSTSAGGVTGEGCGVEQAPPPSQDNLLYACEAMLCEESDGEESNPWNVFPPPSKVFCTSTSSETSPGPDLPPLQAPPDPPGHVEARCELRVGPGALHPDISSTAGPSKGDQSLLPPYQKPPPTGSSPSTSKASPGGRVSGAQPGAVQDPQNLSGEALRTVPSSKKRTSEPHPPGTPAGPEQEQEAAPREDLSPPSWLFESPPGTVPGPGCRARQDRAAVASGSSYGPPVHSDGSSFAYRYKVFLQDAVDLSRASVADHLVHWAVKYLVVPKPVDSNDMNIS